MNTKSFQLNEILSVTTGRLLCGIGNVYEILNHITGDNLFTHVLPRACRFAEPLIKEQYPEIALVGTPENLTKFDTLLDDAKSRSEKPQVAVTMWLDWMKAEFGLKSEYAIPSYADRWLSLDPIRELEGMVGKEKVAVVEL